MRSYFLKRLLLIIPTFIGVTLLVFTMTRFVPGGPVERMILEASSVAAENGGGASQMGGSQALSDDQIEELKAFYGLDQPIHIAYWQWLNKVVRFDLGESTRYYEPVWDMIVERLPISTFYGAMTFLIAYLVSLPLGIQKAMRHQSTFDNLSSLVIFVGYAIPGYIVGVFLISLLAFNLEWFPMGGFVSDEFDDLSTLHKIGDVLWHAALPLVAYILGDFAVLTMTMKNSLMENIAADYVRTAVAKGLPFHKAVMNHALRNSLIPLASHASSVITVFLGGSFLIEVIFDINGIGLLGYEALVEQDYPVVMGILAITSILILLSNILADVIIALVDPRVKFGDSHAA